MADYNTTINIIGSIGNIDLIFDAIESNGSFAEGSGVIELIRTEASKVRINNGIKSAFTAYANMEHRILVTAAVKGNFPFQLKSYLLFLQFSYSNPLFFNLSKNVLIKSIRTGKISLPTEQVVAYVHSLKETNNTIKSWSDSTIYEISKKYLSFLKKLGFVKAGRSNELLYFIPSEEMIITFIYFLKYIEFNSNDIFQSKYIDLIFIELSSLLEKVKSVRLKEYFEIATTGNSLVVELKYNSNEVIDALSKRYQTKI